MESPGTQYAATHAPWEERFANQSPLHKSFPVIQSTPPRCAARPSRRCATSAGWVAPHSRVAPRPPAPPPLCRPRRRPSFRPPQLPRASVPAPPSARRRRVRRAPSGLRAQGPPRVPPARPRRPRRRSPAPVSPANVTRGRVDVAMPTTTPLPPLTHTPPFRAARPRSREAHLPGRDQAAPPHCRQLPLHGQARLHPVSTCVLSRLGPPAPIPLAPHEYTRLYQPTVAFFSPKPR